MSSPEPSLHRSYLYAPGSSPTVMAKALAAGADAVVLDLEDAVAADDKGRARSAVADLLAECAATPQSPDAPDVHVRIDRDRDGYRHDDLAAAVSPALQAVRLPKVEHADAVRDVAAQLDELEADRGLPFGHTRLYLTVESAVGALAIADTLQASPRVVRAAIGTTDLLADLGARGDDDLATLHVRSQLVLVSRAVGAGPPIDSVHTDLDDAAGLEAAARRARALGFVGKSVIHPRQLAATHEVFTPTDAELAHAERIVAAADRGGVTVDGEFVDAAVVARARAVLTLRRAR